MKRFICIILIFASLLLVSCVEKAQPPEKEVGPYAASMMHAAVELPSRVLLVKTGGLWYYSKVDGESYRFCFNPLCQHKWKDKCPSVIFVRSNSLSSQLVYCEENERVYVARGQKIYSLSFDASDLKLECSLGENGDLTDSTFDPSLIRNLRCYGHYIYFIYNNDNTGKLQVIRYNAEKGKNEEMTSADTENIIAYEIADGYIYFKSVSNDNIVGYYTSDYDFNNRVKIDDPISPQSFGMTMEVYDGKYFYGKNEGTLYAFNPMMHKKISISNDEHIGLNAMITAVHNGYVYFMPNSTDKSRAMYSSVFRSSLDGKVEEVLDFPECYILSLNFVSDGVIINFSTISIKNDDKTVNKGNGFIHYDIADNGRFINPKPIGDLADDAELIEYLKGKS